MKTTTTRPINPLFLAIAVLLTGLPLANAQNRVGINTVDPKSDFEVNGSFGLAVTTLIPPFPVPPTAVELDDMTTKSLVVCDNGATAIKIALPAVTGCLGRTYTIKKGTLSTGSVDIMAMPSGTMIDGYASYMLVNKDESVTLFNNGTEWKTIGKSNEPFPMGEINYFNTTGSAISITLKSDGSTNMVPVAPTGLVADGSTQTALSPGSMDFVQRANGQLQYTGNRPKHFHIACTISVKSATGQSDTFVFGIAKGTPGTPDTVTMLTASKVLQEFKDVSSSTALHVAIEMNKNDYLQFYAGNTTNTRNVTIQALTLFALGMD